MAAKYRYCCGECRHRTRWLSESIGAARHREHYAKRHPDIVPGGRVQTRRTHAREGIGCLVVIAILLAVLLVAASCQH